MEALKKKVGQRIRILRASRDRDESVGEGKARRKNSMTLEELAAAAGLTLEYVSRLESGSQNPTLETLWRVSQALGVEVVDLLSDEAGDP